MSILTPAISKESGVRLVPPLSRDQQTTVTVHGDDRLTRAGLISFLRCAPSIEVQDTISHDAERGVAVVFADRIDDSAVVRLRWIARNQNIVLIVARLREPELLRTLDAPVSAILFREQVTPARLLDAVRAAARKDRDLPSDVVGQLVETLKRLRQQVGGDADGAYPPTKRELDVLRLLADGLETREIARKMAYSERTVKKVVHGLTVRFQLRNRTHAVAHALREGYL